MCTSYDTKQENENIEENASVVSFHNVIIKVEYGARSTSCCVIFGILHNAYIERDNITSVGICLKRNISYMCIPAIQVKEMLDLLVLS
jgi:hypothetical protein